VSADQALQQKVDTLPASPGVYLMKDAQGKVIYVGKASQLSHRVRSYFGPSEGLDAKTQTLVERIADVDWIVVPTEKDALLLEDQLVKEYRPRYNIRLKDDKRYPYLRLTVSEPFPRLDVVRKIEPGDDEYYGPFTDARSMRLTLKTLTQILPVRTCELALPQETVPRPCLDYYIDRCCAPCVSYVSQEEYRHYVEQIRLLLQGRSRGLLEELQAKMRGFSEELRYEDAARVRDQIAAVEKVVEGHRRVLRLGSDADVLGLEREGTAACGVVLRIRDGKLVRSEDYGFRSRWEDSFQDYYQRFCTEVFQRSQQMSRQILLQDDLPESALWEELLAERHGHRVHLRVPRRGDRLRLVETARTNARLKLRETLNRERVVPQRVRDDEPGVRDLKERLDLAVAPQTIECFDMSHFQGGQRVGSLVFFSHGAPLKSRYRRFRIKQVEGIDDFAMMQECLERYYSRLRDEDKLPADLVVVDGGAGQLGVGVRTLQRYGFLETSIVGLAKREEEVYVPGRSEPVRLPRTCAGLKLLQRVRDEAHRFAITYHRKLRDRETLHSVLDEIPGIGRVKRRNLLAHFGSAEGVGKAATEDLLAVPSIGERDVQRIQEFFLERDGGPVADA
jgi:excinuclease ABC subunit C